MDLEKVKELPDFLPSETLKLWFQDVMDNYNSNKCDKNSFLQILSELMDRQVLTYELLDINVRRDIDLALCKLWNTDSYDDVDIILSIVVNLGLNHCFDKIKESVSQKEIIDGKILEEIRDTIEEVGDSILNPYSKLEKFK